MVATTDSAFDDLLEASQKAEKNARKRKEITKTEAKGLLFFFI
ncbi:hypothetical protein ACWF7H_10910 [Peribacillus butanolivorans]